MNDADANNIHLVKSTKLLQGCGEEGMEGSHIASGSEPNEKYTEVMTPGHRCIA